MYTVKLTIYILIFFYLILGFYVNCSRDGYAKGENFASKQTQNDGERSKKENT